MEVPGIGRDVSLHSTNEASFIRVRLSNDVGIPQVVGFICEPFLKAFKSADCCHEGVGVKCSVSCGRFAGVLSMLVICLPFGKPEPSSLHQFESCTWVCPGLTFVSVQSRTKL